MYAIRVDKVFRQVDDSYIAINATDIIELLTDQQLECGIMTLFDIRHYVLFIICPKCGMAFILNSSKDSSKNVKTYRLAGLVESVVGSLRWEFPAVNNRQPFDWECGFYMMKWMHDFVLKYPNDNFPNIVPWSDERPLENKELNAIVGAWFTLWCFSL
ncbi:hypothetical protein CTI12_AA249150 [Artemisia annua]|uniref:Ulp1 protease family, C-terminal catalytic domain-containing protein n=1 Tax=Artemisia annua TaxID=35608 RepID=A0A2U1NMJ1_ARTAN|nr:hypothetical protein CTI12_AA249150 [Artemisia annua]